MIVQTASGVISLPEGNEQRVLEMPLIVKTDMEDMLRGVTNLLLGMKERASVNTCKLCILTRGNQIRVDKSMIDKNIISQCYVVHVGNKNLHRARKFANDIDCHLGHFAQTTIDAFVEHFIFYF